MKYQESAYKCLACMLGYMVCHDSTLKGTPMLNNKGRIGDAVHVRLCAVYHTVDDQAEVFGSLGIDRRLKGGSAECCSGLKFNDVLD